MEQKSPRVDLTSIENICDFLRTSPDTLQTILTDTESFIRTKFQKIIDGKKRNFTVPNKKFSDILKKFDRLLRLKIKFPPYIYGWVKNKSQKSNAERHKGAKYLFVTDISSFFPNITQKMLKKTLMEYGFKEDTADIFSRICTYQGILPHGYNTSPTLANIVFLNTDKRLHKLAKKNMFIYSRCGDDISISGNKPTYPLFGTVNKIVNTSGFLLSTPKTRHYGPSDKKVITKLVINSSPRPDNDKITTLKRDIRSLWEGGIGLNELAKRNHKSPMRMLKNIWGRMHYVKSANPKLYRSIRGLMVKAKVRRAPLL